MSSSVNVDRALPSVLQEGETVLWRGQPDPRLMLRRADWQVIPTSVLFSAFSIYFANKLWSQDDRQASLSALLVTITFLPYGQYLLWGRLIFESWLRPRTFYFATDRRVFALQKVMSWRIAIHNLEDIAQVRTYDVRSGRGTVRFSCKDDMYTYPSRENVSQTPVWIVKGFDPAFIDLPETDLKSLVAMVDARRKTTPEDRARTAEAIR